VTTQNRRDEVLLYLGGALDVAEKIDVERYLAEGGPRAAGDLAEAEATLAHLAQSLEPIDPPDRVAEALMRRVHDARPRPLMPSQRAASAQPAPARRRGRVYWSAASAAAAALLVYVGVSDVLGRRVTDLERAVIQQNEKLTLLETSSAALRILSSDGPEVKTIEFQGPALGYRGFGRMVQNWQTGECYFYSRGLRAPADGLAYRVWFTTMEGEIVPGGLLTRTRSGEASYFGQMPRNVDVGAAVLVTLEPSGRIARPSGAPQLTGEVRF
jgi:hypothetical protein